MAYGRRKKNGFKPPTRNGGGKGASVALTVNTTEGSYECFTPKVYTDKSSVVQDIDDNDGFITLSSFSKSLGALTVHNAKVLVIKNVGLTAIELLIKHVDWRNDGGADGVSDTTTDVINSVDMNEENSTGEETLNRYASMLLPVGDFIYLPNTRLIGYQPLSDATLESAANSPAGGIAIEPKDIASGAEIIPIHNFAGTTYFSGTDVQIAEDVAIDETEINVQDGDWFESGDLIVVGTEVMEVESVSGIALTVNRGLLGSVQAVHSDDDDLNFFIGNEYLAFDNGKCQTDQNGSFKQRGAFFSFARTADKKIKGVVPGSVAILRGFTEGGYLDWGLQNIKASDETGLAASTAYAITFVIDEYNAGGIDSTTTEQIVSFTTDASDTTFASSGNAVIPKIQAQLDAYFYDAASGLKNKKVTIGLHNGDVRVTSNSNHSETRVGISKSTSGTTPFDLGRFPTMTSDVPNLQGSPHGGGTTDTIVYGPASSLALETIVDSVTGQEVTNTSAFLFDDGNGNLLHNGSAVGSVDYTTGHCQFAHLPNAEFKVYGQTYSAHSGGLNFTSSGNNFIIEVGARSVNTKEDSQIQLIVLG